MRAGRKKLLLLLEGYTSHVQYSVLDLLHHNNVIVIGLPAHTSQLLQPLDVSVFSSVKSYIQREFHRRGRDKRVLDAFDIVEVLNFVLSDALTTSNIVSGFRK